MGRLPSSESDDGSSDYSSDPGTRKRRRELGSLGVRGLRCGRGTKAHGDSWRQRLTGDGEPEGEYRQRNDGESTPPVRFPRQTLASDCALPVGGKRRRRGRAPERALATRTLPGGGRLSVDTLISAWRGSIAGLTVGDWLGNDSHGWRVVNPGVRCQFRGWRLAGVAELVATGRARVGRDEGRPVREERRPAARSGTCRAGANPAGGTASWAPGPWSWSSARYAALELPGGWSSGRSRWEGARGPGGADGRGARTMITWGLLAKGLAALGVLVAALWLFG